MVSLVRLKSKKFSTMITQESYLVVDEKASFRPLILDRGGATGWGQRPVQVYLQV